MFSFISMYCVSKDALALLTGGSPDADLSASLNLRKQKDLLRGSSVGLILLLKGLRI